MEDFLDKMKQEHFEICNGKDGYKIVEVSGYDYEHSGSIRVLSCMFDIDEKEIVEKIERYGNKINYYNYQEKKNIDKKCYLENCNLDATGVFDAIATFETFKKALEILKWMYYKGKEIKLKKVILLKECTDNGIIYGSIIVDDTVSVKDVQKAIHDIKNNMSEEMKSSYTIEGDIIPYLPIHLEYYQFNNEVVEI